MKRVLSALLLAPPICYLLYNGPDWAFTAVVVAVGLMCFHEYTGLAAAHGAPSGGPLGYGAGLLILLIPSQQMVVVVVVAAAAMALAMRSGDLRAILPGAAAVTLGIVYVFGSLRFGLALRELSPHWLAFALMLNWAGDTGAYVVGKWFGKHKLAPSISPAKSWEGAAASVVVSLAFGVLYIRAFLPAVSWPELIGLSVVASVAGQIGDLAESAMKRGAGVKDSGRWLPGHGGWLDRLDSCLFAFPVVFAWLARY